MTKRPTALRRAIRWVEENTAALREFEWSSTGPHGLIRCDLGDGRQGCPLSVLVPTGPEPVTDALDLADAHGLPDSVAEAITDAADSYDDARPSLRRALVEATELKVPLKELR